jgi:hypothetical protein
MYFRAGLPEEFVKKSPTLYEAQTIFC